MGSVTMGLDGLHQCLLSIAPIELKGMGLLRKQPQLITGIQAVPRVLLVEAVTEIIEYTARCAAAARNLEALTPIPLLHISVLEFGL